MFDSSFDRTLSYRLASAYDCWGNRRALRCGKTHGIWFVSPIGFDEQPSPIPVVDPTPARAQTLARFTASGRFTVVELETLRALMVERLTVDDIARRDGCSRQAVLARVVGNSRGQGGLLKKARALQQRDAATSAGASH
jgi:predicted DNA-binding protein (UPF0251 family)